MSKTKDSIYSKYLSELHEFEESLQEETLEDFEEWRKIVIDSLEGSYRIRFSKLKFYEEEPDFDDDVPF